MAGPKKCLVESSIKSNLGESSDSLFFDHLTRLTILILIFVAMASLDSLSPQEKMDRYMQLNGSPDPNTYASYSPIENPPTDNTPVKTVDYMASMPGALPPLVAPSTPGGDKIPNTTDKEGDKSTTPIAAVKPGANTTAYTTPVATMKPSIVAAGVKVPTATNPAADIIKPWQQQYQPNQTPLNFSNFEAKVRNQESGNKSNPKANPNSSATGYYQFLWNDWHDSIKNVTGITDRQTFANSPEAQKQFFKYYYDKHIVPSVNKIRGEFAALPLSDFDLARLVHFRGTNKLEHMIRDGSLNKQIESYNPTALDYLKQ